MNSLTRLYLAAALASCWMILLFTGFVLSGLVHLLLAAAVFLFPWRGARRDVGREEADDAPPD